VVKHIRTEVIDCSNRRSAEGEPDVCRILGLVEEISDYIWMDANDSALRHIMYGIFYSDLPVRHCYKYLLLSLMSMRCSHFSGFNDDLIYPYFVASEWLH
jgi:hypothetical protein